MENLPFSNAAKDIVEDVRRELKSVGYEGDIGTFTALIIAEAMIDVADAFLDHVDRFGPATRGSSESVILRQAKEVVRKIL